MNVGVYDIKHRMWKVFVDAPYDSRRVGLVIVKVFTFVFTSVFLYSVFISCLYCVFFMNVNVIDTA